MTNKAAIRVLEQIKEHPTLQVYLPDEYEALTLAIKALEKRPQSEWIPVSDRLPDISERCIVQLTDGYITIGSYLGIDNWMCKEISSYSYPTKCIIAWQPLPESYMGGAE